MNFEEDKADRAIWEATERSECRRDQWDSSQGNPLAYVLHKCFAGSQGRGRATFFKRTGEGLKAREVLETSPQSQRLSA